GRGARGVLLDAAAVGEVGGDDLARLDRRHVLGIGGGNADSRVEQHAVTVQPTPAGRAIDPHANSSLGHDWIQYALGRWRSSQLPVAGRDRLQMPVNQAPRPAMAVSKPLPERSKRAAFGTR